MLTSKEILEVADEYILAFARKIQEAYRKKYWQQFMGGQIVIASSPEGHIELPIVSPKRIIGYISYHPNNHHQWQFNKNLMEVYTDTATKIYPLYD